MYLNKYDLYIQKQAAYNMLYKYAKRQKSFRDATRSFFQGPAKRQAANQAPNKKIVGEALVNRLEQMAEHQNMPSVKGIAEGIKEKNPVKLYESTITAPLETMPQVAQDVVKKPLRYVLPAAGLTAGAAATGLGIAGLGLVGLGYGAKKLVDGGIYLTRKVKDKFKKPPTTQEKIMNTIQEYYNQAKDYANQADNALKDYYNQAKVYGDKGLEAAKNYGNQAGDAIKDYYNQAKVYGDKGLEAAKNYGNQGLKWIKANPYAAGGIGAGALGLAALPFLINTEKNGSFVPPYVRRQVYIDLLRRM